MNNPCSIKSTGKTPARRARRRSFLQRLKLALPCACLLCFTFFFFGPYETVALNTSSFAYHYSSIILPLLLTAIAASLCLALIASLLPGKLFCPAAAAVFSTGLCMYLQAAFFNGTLTELTGDAVDWAAQKPQILINLTIWLLIFAAVFAFMLLRRKAFRSFAVYACALLLVMQTTSVFAILFGAYDGTQKKESSAYTLQNAGLSEFSRDHNVVVLVLDRLDYEYLEDALAERPDMLDFMDGFTLYDNATSVYHRTKPSLAHLLNGNTELAFHTTPEDYYSESWHSSGRSILEDIHAQGYTIELYTEIDNLFSKPQADAQLVMNLSDGDQKLLPLNIVKRMTMLSCYRFLPIAAKPYFFRDTNYYNSQVYASELYEMNDAKNGAALAGIEAPRRENSFKLIHLNGSHTPYTLTVGGTISDYPTSVLDQTIGSFAILRRMFERMKQLSIYENAAIIITADHGVLTEDPVGIPRGTRIGLFLKPAGSAGTPHEISSAPVSTQNIPASILKAMGADYSAYAPALDDVPEDEPLTRVHYQVIESEKGDDTFDVTTYHITADASDPKNWERIEFFEIPSIYNLY